LESGDGSIGAPIRTQKRQLSTFSKPSTPDKMLAAWDPTSHIRSSKLMTDDCGSLSASITDDNYDKISLEEVKIEAHLDKNNQLDGLSKGMSAKNVQGSEN